MNTMDTIHLTGNLVAEKLCGCKESLPVIIQQAKEPCYYNATTITHIICVTLAVVAFLFIIKPLIESCYKNKEKQRERKFQELESCIKLKHSYQSKLLDELLSANIHNDYKTKLEEYIKELNARIKELNKGFRLFKH